MSRENKVSPFLKQCFVTAAVGINIMPWLRSRLPGDSAAAAAGPGSRIQLTKEEESWIAFLAALFILVGNFMASPIMDKLGRKTAHYTVTIASIVAWFTIVEATNVKCFVTAAVGINILGHGCTHGFPAILLPQLREPGSRIQLTKDEESWIASLTPLFILVGNLIGSPIMDRLGRKAAHYAVAVPSIAGWFIMVLATNVKYLMFARVILGMACGQLNNLRSVLIGEYTSPENRGAFLTTVSLSQGFGIFLVHLLGTFFSWQTTALICSFFPFTSLLMIIYTPESPSWFAGRGRYEECQEVFRWLRGDNEEDELTELIEARIELRKENFVNNKVNDNRIRTILMTVLKKEFYKPIILMVHANTISQFCGGTIMSVYSTEVLKLILGSAANVYFWMVFLDSQRFITNAAAIYIINKTRRRTMMFTYGAICIISHLAITFYVYGKMHSFMPVHGVWFPALLVNIQIFTVGIAMVPMPNIIAGEVFPLEYRGIGATISVASLAISSFFVVKTFPSLIEATGLHGTYLLYSIILTYCLLVVWVLLPETKGRTLQQIEDEWRGRTQKSYDTAARKSLQKPLETIENKSKMNKEVSV